MPESEMDESRDLMKKINKEKLRFKINAGNKRFYRAKRTIKGPGAGGVNTGQLFLVPNIDEALIPRSCESVTVVAPAKLDIYKDSNYESFAGFIKRLRFLAQHNDKLLISFRDTHRITAGAGLRLVAEVDHLLKIHPSLSINCTIPPRQAKKKYKNAEMIVESALQQIGFFKAIGQYERALPKYANVVYWNQLSGDMADGSLAASLLSFLPPQIDKRAKSHLYRGAIEAIANCVEHAYPTDPVESGIPDKRWWMLAGVKENSLTIIVCDLGVGIPNTLPLKHPESLLTHITRTFNILGETDADLIRKSTFIKRTRTLMTHRGKGGADIRSITEHYPEALLSIRSNRGSYVVVGADFKHKKRDKGRAFIAGTNEREWASNHSTSIYGTLIEWTISLEAIGK